MNPAVLYAIVRSTHPGYCTTCHRDNVKIVNSDVVNMSTECEDCYNARTLQNQIQEDKQKRAEQVRMYFAKRK